MRVLSDEVRCGAGSALMPGECRCVLSSIGLLRAVNQGFMMDVSCDIRLRSG